MGLDPSACTVNVVTLITKYVKPINLYIQPEELSNAAHDIHQTELLLQAI